MISITNKSLPNYDHFMVVDDPISLGNNKYSVKQNGKYISVQPDGTIQYRDSVGAFETFTIQDDNKLVCSYQWNNARFTFVFPFVEYVD